MKPNISSLLKTLCLSVLLFTTACNDKNQPAVESEVDKKTASSQPKVENTEGADLAEQTEDKTNESVEVNDTSESEQQSIPSLSTKAQSAQNIKQSFPNLKAYHLKDLGITLYYDPANAQKLSEKHPDPEMQEMGVERVLRGELLGKGKGEYLLECDPGPSGDPNCSISKANEDGSIAKRISIFSGLNFVIPGNGYIYSSGHTNTMYDTRRKYEWRNGEFQEVPQASYYVGLDTKTTKTVQLMSSKNSSKVVANLPANSPVTVLINEGDYYLLKTPFGLTGWVKIEGFPVDGQGPIKGIYFAGD